MKDRIRQIMENERLTPSAFADQLQLGRAVMSHILNGRNNPSLDVVTRILTKIPKVNPEWLLLGKGDMYTSVNNSDPIPVSTHSDADSPAISANTIIQSDLFIPNDRSIDDISKNSPSTIEEPLKPVEESKSELTKNNNIPIEKTIVYSNSIDKKISKIIVYYSNNTFESFNTDNNPL